MHRAPDAELKLTPAELPAQAVRAAEGLGSERREVVDVLRLAHAEERAEERSGSARTPEGLRALRERQSVECVESDMAALRKLWKGATSPAGGGVTLTGAP